MPAPNDTDVQEPTVDSATGQGTTDTGGDEGSLLAEEEPTTPQDEGSLLATEQGGDDEDPASDDEPQGAPEEYAEFTMPEGVEVDKKILDQFTPLAKDMNLSQEQAQKMVDLYASKAAEAQQQAVKALIDQRVNWRKEVKSDPNWEENVGFARKAIDKFADDDARALLTSKESWLGDNPAILRFLEKIGRATAEDPFIEGKGDGRPTGKAAEEIMYPSMRKST